MPAPPGPQTAGSWCNQIHGCTQFTVRILRSAKSPECVGPRTPTVVWFSAVTSARLTSECEPPYPALHNRSFRPPSSSTQPPTGAHVTRRPRRVPSMGLHLQRAPPVAGSTSSELHLLQALPPASSTCSRDGRRRGLRCANERRRGPRALRSPLGR